MAYSFQNRKSVGTRRGSRSRSFVNTFAPLLATGFGFVAFALLIPTNASQKSEARIFTQGLSIQIDRSSPAYAALEDSLVEDIQGESPKVENGVIATRTAVLVSGMTSSADLAERIAKETKREEALLAQERSMRIANARAIETHIVDAGIDHREIQSAMAAGATVITSTGAVLTSEPALQKPIEHPPVVISLKSLGLANREQLARSFAAPIVSAARTARATAPPRTVASSRVDTSSLQNTRDTVSLAVRAEDLPTENQNEEIRQLVISGNIEFTGGIAITSANDRVVIYREEENEKLEPGAVWLRDARYEIFVDRPIGRLVGELRAVSGEILGRGYYDLDRLPKVSTKSYRATNVALKIGPVPQGIAGRVTNAEVAGARAFAVADADVTLEQLPYKATSAKDGQFSERTLLESSSIITRTERRGHWGTLSFAHVGEPLQVSLFADQAMRALISAAAPADLSKEHDSAFIWGRVTRGGALVAGARVDLMTSERDVKPIYFNALGMPDPSLNATTANGLYAFFPVEPGAHAVQAGDSHGLTEPALFPTDARVVTQMDLELKITRRATIRVFDAFKTEWPLAAEVISAGRKRGVVVPREGEASVTFAGGKALLVLDADAGTKYAATRICMDRNQRVLDFPMIESLWLDRMRGSLRIPFAAESGTIIGFVRGAAMYKVALDEASLAPGSSLVYFDEAGNISRSGFGKSGGGFAIFNVPEGFRTVLIEPSGTSKALASTVLVERRVTNVISKNL